MAQTALSMGGMAMWARIRGGICGTPRTFAHQSGQKALVRASAAATGMRHAVELEVGPHLADGVVRSFHLENEGMPRPRASKPVDRDKQQGEYKRCPSPDRAAGDASCRVTRTFWRPPRTPAQISAAKAPVALGGRESAANNLYF